MPQARPSISCGTRGARAVVAVRGAGFAAQNQAWLRIYRMPACAPELNPADWSLLERAMANFGHATAWPRTGPGGS